MKFLNTIKISLALGSVLRLDVVATGQVGSTLNGVSPDTMDMDNVKLWSSSLSQPGDNFKLGAEDSGDLMPITLISFNATYMRGSVAVSWSTASELNSSHYEIQRSVDGQTSETILLVAGQGTSSNINEYSANDADPYMGTSYYRLKQIDEDGRSSYSTWVRVETDAQRNNSSVIPNPSDGGQVTVYVSSDELDEYLVSVLDIRGAAKRLPSTVHHSGGTQSFCLDTSTLPPGVYLITGQSSTDRFTHRLIVR